MSTVKREQLSRKEFGCYDEKHLRAARLLPTGVGTPVRNQNAFHGLAAVPDPVQHPGERPGPQILATRNRRDDILLEELSHHRISQGALGVGRVLEAVFERSANVGSSSSWQGGDRVDQWAAHEIAIIRNLDNARETQGHLDRLRSNDRGVGRMDARIIELVLRERKTYGDVAVAIGRRANREAVTYIASRFRDGLEQLADLWGATGRGHGSIRAERSTATADDDGVNV